MIKFLKKLTPFLFIALLILGIFARFYRFGQVPLGTYWDETSILAEARSIVDRGVDTHGQHWPQPIFPAYGDYKLPVYIWLTAISVRLLGPTAVAVRLPSAIAGLATMGVAILIAHRLLKKEKFDAQLTTAVSLVFLLSPWSIQFSRTGFEGHVGQLLLGAAVYFALAEDKLQQLFLAQILAVLATYTYFSVRYVWPVMFVTIILVQSGSKLIDADKNREWWRYLLLPAGIVVLGLLIFFTGLRPLVSSSYYQPMQTLRFSTDSIFNSQDWAVLANQLRAQAGNTVTSRIFYHRHWLLIRALLKNISDHLSLSYLFLIGDSNLRHGTGRYGLFLLPMFIFFVLGWWRLAQKHVSSLIILGVWWLAAIIPASAPETTPHALRSLNALIPLGLIIAVGGYHLWFWLKNNSSHFWKNILVVSFLGMLIVCFGSYNYHYFTVYPQLSAREWQAGFKPAAERICQLQDQYQQVIVDVNDGQFNQWLLAYCRFESRDLQQAEFDNFHLKQIKNIMFTDVGSELLGDKGKLIVTTLPLTEDNQKLVDFVAKYPYPPFQQERSINFYQTHGQ